MAIQTNPDAINDDFIKKYIQIDTSKLDLEGQMTLYTNIVSDYIKSHPIFNDYLFGDRYKKGGLNVLERGYVKISLSFLLTPETIIEKCIKYCLPYVKSNLETSKPVMDFDNFFKEVLTLNESEPPETQELKAILYLIWGDLNKEDKYLIEVYVKRFTLIAYHIISIQASKNG